VADSQDYPPDVQHLLARTLTLIMSSGVVGSVVSGLLMDRLGLQQCAVVLLLLGICHASILITFHGQFFWMVGGFLVYTQFRSLLYPLYIGSISSQLGFKYFGLLNGLGFAIAGIAQVFQASLVQHVQGSCHYLATTTTYTATPNACDGGLWTQLHQTEVLILVALMLAPACQGLEDARRKRSTQTLLRQRSSVLHEYGSMLRISEDQAGDVDYGLVI
jgi:hypothetical protein